MPSVESLRHRQYYAHSRNSFWPIVSRLLQIEADSYTARAEALADRGIAVWDVLKSCVRPGSLDSAIELQSAEVNDFAGFFDAHSRISRVCFNGKLAGNLFERRVAPALSPRQQAIARMQLPSTSPANASWSFERKLEAWQPIAIPPDL